MEAGLGAAGAVTAAGPANYGKAGGQDTVSYRQAGLGYEELVRRFGPPTMAITNSAGRSLTYQGKDGVFLVEVRDGVVAAIVKPHR